MTLKEEIEVKVRKQFRAVVNGNGGYEIEELVDEEWEFLKTIGSYEPSAKRVFEETIRAEVMRRLDEHKTVLDW